MLDPATPSETPAHRLRRALAASGGSTLIVPGCFDPLSARLAEDAGFETLYVGGYATATHLGTTAPLLNATDLAGQTARIAAAITSPLIVDAEDGWGDTPQAVRAMRNLEHAGAAGMHIEDNLFPKSARWYNDEVVVDDRNQFVRKFAAVRERRLDPATVLIGRTNAYAATNGSPIEAFRRAELLAEAGADLIFVYAPADAGHQAAVRRALPDLPLVTINHGDLPSSVHSDLGFEVVLYPTIAVVAAAAAVTAAWAAVRKGRPCMSTRDYDASRRALRTMAKIDDVIALERAGATEDAPGRAT